MIYKNDNIEITNDYIKGTIEDLKEYFRYEIATQCMSGTDCCYENFRDNVKNIIDLLDNLYEDTDNNIFSDDDFITVKEHSMGGYLIEKGED